jgi:hypothetical protein
VTITAMTVMPGIGALCQTRRRTNMGNDAVSVVDIKAAKQKIKVYKEALEEVLINLRSIEIPNEADSYIDDSINIITSVLAKGEDKFE